MQLNVIKVCTLFNSNCSTLELIREIVNFQIRHLNQNEGTVNHVY
jgi:hypothetical protein